MVQKKKKKKDDNLAHNPKMLFTLCTTIMYHKILSKKLLIWNLSHMLDKTNVIHIFQDYKSNFDFNWTTLNIFS